MIPEAGFSNAQYFEQYGSIKLWFKNGTITFGGLKLHEANGAHGIDLPYGVEDVTLIAGNGDRDVSMDGSGIYSAYVQTADGSNWTTGSDKFTFRKVASGSFADYIGNTFNLSLEGGTTTFNCDCAATTITVTNATIATAADRTLGTVTFGEGAALALNTNATITVQNATLDVSNLTVTYTDGQAAALAAAGKDYDGVTSFTLLNCANSGTVTGTPKSEELKCADTDYAWKVLVKNAALVFARKYVKPGLYIHIR